MKRTEAEKAKVFELSGKGWRGCDISRFLSLPESTVSYILHHSKTKAVSVPEPSPKKPPAKPLPKKPVPKAIPTRPQIRAIQNKIQAKAILKRLHTRAMQNRQQTKAVVKKPQVKAPAVTDSAQKRQIIKRSEEERAEVVRLSQQGWSISQIASFMDFPTSTVFYIVKRARDTAGISGALLNKKLMGWKNGPTNQVKSQVVAKKPNDSGRDSPESISHTAEMIGSLRMKIQTVAEKMNAQNGKGTPAGTQRTRLMSSQKVKGQTPGMSDKLRPASRQGMQTASREAKVIGGLRIMEMMDDESRPNSRHDTRPAPQKVDMTGSQKKKPYISHSKATRMEVLRRFEQGERECDIARTLGIGASTIRAMRNSKCLWKQYKEAGWSDSQSDVLDGWGSGDDADDCMEVDRDVKEEVEVGIESVDDDLSPAPPLDLVIESMERLLKIWIDGQVSRGCVVRDEAIQSKAMSLWQFVFNGLTREEAADVADDFQPSVVWLRQFKERAGLYTLSSYPSHSPTPSVEVTTVDVSVEETEAAAQPRRGEGRGVDGYPNQKMNEGVAKEFSTLLRGKVELGGYTARQVINMAETRLSWKRLPTNTVVALNSFTSQGLKASTDSFSLLLGANATGDLKLKPLLVYQQEKPCSLAGYIKEHLPVIWRTHPKARLTAALCQNYVVEYLSQQCREYAAQHNLENRFLLVVEAGPAHPPSMEDWAENFEVIFVAPNSKNGSNSTTKDSTAAAPVTQPMGQGISSTFNLCYLRRVFEQLIRETDSGSDNYLSVCSVWEAYNIKKALCNIKMAWDDVAPSTLNAAWQNVWPECVEDSLTQNIKRETSEVSEDAVVSLAHRAGFFLVNAENVRDWKDSHDQDPQNNKQANMNANSAVNHKVDKQCEEAEEEQDTEVVKTLDVKSLHHALSILDEAMAVFEDSDPNLTRSCEARELVEAGIKGYRELLAAKRRKAQNSSFFSALNHKQQQQEEDQEEQEEMKQEEDKQEEKQEEEEKQDDDEEQMEEKEQEEQEEEEEEEEPAEQEQEQ